MDIDLRTFALLVVIASVLQAFAIAFLYTNNKKYPGIGWWVLGSALPAIGVFLLLLRDVIPIAFLTIILSNALLIAGSVFIYVGIMRFLNKRENPALIISVFVLYTVLYFYFTYVSDDITIRTVIQSLTQSFYILLAGLILSGEMPRAIKVSARFMAGVEFFLAFFLLIRAGDVILISPVSSFFNATLIQTATFMFYFAGGFLLTIGLIIMVNQRLNADVTEAKDEFELIFNTSPDGILILGLENLAIVDINKGFTDLTGYSRDDSIGLSTLDLHLWKNPDDRQKVLDQVQNKGVFENFEVVLQRKDGSELIGILSARIITLHGITCILTVTRDITDRKMAEEALQQANGKLNLLSSITRHDILNTVTVLTGYLGLAREEPADPKLREYLDHLDVSAEKIQHQIEFTREYQEIGVNEATWQNVGETVQNASAEFEVDGVTLNIFCRDIEIFADPLLEKVFYNFFDNAFRYAPPFKTISVSCIEKEGRLSVVFADDGRGVSEDFKKRLFTRGFGNNTGLGLFLSREILAITGITITENGKEGEGARFEMTVPKGSFREVNSGDSS